MDYKIIWTGLLNNVLALTIIIIILTSMINAFIKQRARDKCLKDFRGCSVTILMKSGEKISGRLRLFSTGVEIEYIETVYDEKEDFYKYSYIAMHPELEANVWEIHRYHWDLTPKNRSLRERSIRKSYKPSIFRRFGRALKNIVNTLRDAVSRSINLFIGQIGGKVAGGRATKDLTSVSSTIVGTVGNTYDPVLEKYIGRWVVVELNEGGSLKKYEGILKEYTAKYLELLNVRYNFSDEIDNKQYRSIDLIAPRTLIRVRHGGKKEKLSLKELLGLDNITHNKTGT